MGPGKPELIHICMSRVSWDPFNPDWIASATNTDLAQVMTDTQHLIHIQLNNGQKWAKVVGTREEGRIVEMQTVNGETFIMKREGQDTTSGYRGHSTYFPHFSPNIATNRAKPGIWLGGEKTGQEKDRMGPSYISPPSSTTGAEE